MPWTRRKKVLTTVPLSLGVIAAWPCLIAFTLYYNLTAWRCPPRPMSSLAEIPTVGPSLSAWQTSGPVYYRYRPGFGDGCRVVVAGLTSSEAITVFRAVARDEPHWNRVAQENVNEAVEALSSVPGFAFTQSEENRSFRWLADGANITVDASFDPRSGWFVAAVGSSSTWDAD